MESAVNLMVLLCSVSVFAEENVIRFHSSDRQTIVQTHNDLRRSIYNAANMRELTWNHAVAHAAREWAQKCEFISRPDKQWGQNMNYFHGREADRSPRQLFEESFKNWSDDSDRKLDGHRSYRYCGRKHTCSYVQLIAADVQEVGCAMVSCPRLLLKAPEEVKQDAKLLVCFYTPWVNIAENEVFVPQKRCDACPAGTTCVDYLCSARFHTDSNQLPSIGEPANKQIEIEDKTGRRSPTGSRDMRVGHGDHRSSKRQRNREHRKQQNISTGHSSGRNNDPTVTYTSNNRVVPFPGREESEDVRHIRRIERRRQRKKARNNPAELKDIPVTVLIEEIEKNLTSSISHKTVDSSSRTKRQADPRYYDVRYLRRLEYERYLRERQRLIRERYEEERRRTRRARQLEEQRRLRDERLRQQRERELRRRRVQALTLDEGQLKGEEQYFIISAHNLLRQEAGARALTWSSRLERWARYVIRCDVEYPGPIRCHTNFGKAEQGEEIYNVVYNWGAEGKDVNMPLRNGCRTPYDKSRCNHNTIITNPELTQMACASIRCGLGRQLTCIYNDA